MIRTSTAAVILAAICAAAAAPAVAQPTDTLTPQELRQLIDDYKMMKLQFETLKTHVQNQRERLDALERENERLREALTRRGVDVEELLAPPTTTQPAVTADMLIFESPESVAQWIRDNYSARIRDDMTRLQRESAQKDFDLWLDSADLLVHEVDWILRVDDAWRAEPGDATPLSYSQDRQTLAPAMEEPGRCMTRLEMAEMQVRRLKARQQDLQGFYKQRVDEMNKAAGSRKGPAEERMKSAYADLIEVNAALRKAEGAYDTKLRIARQTGTTTQPDDKGYDIRIRGWGARDRNVELTVFCHEKFADRLMAAPKGSLIKVRGCLTDIAVGERVASVGLRMDQVQVLAVNVQSPPPPPAVPLPQIKRPEDDAPPE
ncbi:MAG: hypothetical protein BIFFINMI_02659 [Phycisphaerae bacterium]|nr:hypothetical protein [Phycisphaerae bacterium]